MPLHPVQPDPIQIDCPVAEYFQTGFLPQTCFPIVVGDPGKLQIPVPIDSEFSAGNTQFPEKSKNLIQITQILKQVTAEQQVLYLKTLNRFLQKFQ